MEDGEGGAVKLPSGQILLWLQETFRNNGISLNPVSCLLVSIQKTEISGDDSVLLWLSPRLSRGTEGGTVESLCAV